MSGLFPLWHVLCFDINDERLLEGYIYIHIYIFNICIADYSLSGMCIDINDQCTALHHFEV